MDISIVILTYNRPDMLAENLRGLSALRDRVRELIVVDNSSNDETGELVASDFDWVDYVRNDNSAGVAGRNTGMDRAVGEIVVTLDDDVTGLAIDDLDLVASAFADDDELGGLCFRVLHHETGEVCNWCHHRRDGSNPGEFISMDGTCCLWTRATCGRFGGTTYP